MVLGANTATGRIEASSQIRNFQLMAYDDFALSRPPVPSGCGTATNPCTTQDMILAGDRMPNESAGSAVPFTVRYAWDPVQQVVTRYVGGGDQTAAANVTAYSWYVDSTEEHPVVVVRLTVTVDFFDTDYSESQTLLFYPRVTSP
jgi:hypothetical protein